MSLITKVSLLCVFNWLLLHPDHDYDNEHISFKNIIVLSSKVFDETGTLVAK